MQEFKNYIYSLNVDKYDSEFYKDIIELAEESNKFKKDILDFCKKNNIQPLTNYPDKKAVEIFQSLSRFCCERSIFYGLAEKGDDEIYTY